MKITVDGKSVEIKELSVADVREYLRIAESETLAGATLDPVIDLMFDGFSLRDIAAMTDLSLEGMDALTPKQINAIADACKEVNPSFFQMADRAQDLLNRLASQCSTAALQLSQEPGTQQS